MNNRVRLILLLTSIIGFSHTPNLEATEFVGGYSIEDLFKEKSITKTSQVIVPKEENTLKEIDINQDMITNNIGGYRNNVKYIVIHETGNSDVGADADMHSYYYQQNSRGASAHFTIDSNKVVQNVETNRIAYHVGDGFGRNGITNTNSIGIEMCINEDGDFEETKQKTIELVSRLMYEFNIHPDNIVTHQDASGKYCPETILGTGEWENFKRTIINVNQRITVENVYKNTPEQLYTFVEDSVLETNEETPKPGMVVRFN